MNKILVISPHFDDAVLSVGQFMANRPDAEVVTVFGGFPLTPKNIHSSYDEKCGFENALDAINSRRRENDEALALLQATKIDLEFPDSQYENGLANIVTVEQITEELQKIIDTEIYEFILAPIGVGHPDHIKTNSAVLNLKTDLNIYLWEDLPLRVLQPCLVSPRLEQLGLTLDKLLPSSTTNDKIAKKIRSMLCYKSQINTGILDPYIMYVPERVWKYQ